jgi:predicted membrane-bound spermidine synthase
VARCPMCHHANEGSAWRCDSCGYEFGQTVEKLREMLRDQLASARVAFWTALSLDAAFLGAAILGVVYGFVFLPWLPFIGTTMWTLRANHKISVSKHSLLLIEPKLPKATLLPGGS